VPGGQVVYGLKLPDIVLFVLASMLCVTGVETVYYERRKRHKLKRAAKHFKNDLQRWS
jgi:hypothetical protein